MERVLKDDPSLQLQQKHEAAEFLKYCLGNMEINSILNKKYKQEERITEGESEAVKIARQEKKNNLSFLLTLSYKSQNSNHLKLAAINKKSLNALKAFKDFRELQHDKKITMFELVVLLDMTYLEIVLEKYKSLFAIDPYLADIYSDCKQSADIYYDLLCKTHDELEEEKTFAAGTMSLRYYNEAKLIRNQIYGIDKTCGNVHTYAWYQDITIGSASIEVLLPEKGGFVGKQHSTTKDLIELLTAEYYEIDFSTLLPEKVQKKLKESGMIQKTEDLQKFMQERYSQEFSNLSMCICTAENTFNKEDRTKAMQINNCSAWLRSKIGNTAGFVIASIIMSVFICNFFPFYVAIILCPTAAYALSVIFPGLKYNLGIAKFRKSCDKIMENTAKVKDELVLLLGDKNKKTMLCSEFVARVMLATLASVYSKLISEKPELKSVLKEENDRLFPLERRFRLAILTPEEFINQMSFCLKQKQLSKKILDIIDINTRKDSLKMRPESKLEWLQRSADEFCYNTMKNLVIEDIRTNRPSSAETKQARCREELNSYLNKYTENTSKKPPLSDLEKELILSKHTMKISEFFLKELKKLTSKNTPEQITTPNLETISEQNTAKTPAIKELSPTNLKLCM